MNKQKVYDDVCAHLIAQNSRSLDENHFCVYRSAEGKKCAVGGIMPDHIYNSNMESKTVFSHRLIPLLDYLDCEYSKNEDNVSGADVAFLSGLQSIHDECEPCQWKDSLKDFGRFNKLEIPSVLGE